MKNTDWFDQDFFTLGAPVGPDQPNRRQDVIKVETILGNTGHHDLAATSGPLGWWGSRQDKAVRTWQGENGLKVDGLLKPNGPTITSLRRAAGGLLGDFRPPSPAEVDDHHDRLSRGEPGILNTRPARLSLARPRRFAELDEQSLAFNADSARSLSGRGVDGDIPGLYARFARQAGIEAARPTVLDFAERVLETEGRDRTDRVLHGIIGRLPAGQASELLGGAPPPPRPLGVRVSDLPEDDAVPLLAFAPAPQPGPVPGPTPTGGEEPGPMPQPAPAPQPAPKPPIPPPPPKPVPNPQPGPSPDPQPEPKPKPDTEPPKDSRCKELHAALEQAKAELQAAESEHEQAVAAHKEAVAAEDAAWDRFVSAAIEAGVGAAGDCVAGLLQPAKGKDWRAQVVGRVIACLKKAAHGGTINIDSAIAAFSQWRDADSMVNEARKVMDKSLKALGCSDNLTILART
ncbi:MAG: hypothetical protein HQL42_11260 [Alphaproteobacteria bacterium]|nr:hypothetical protein [Alphaproteobacteria bacterium]